MSNIQIWYKDNDMVIEVDQVTNKLTGALIDDATITATLQDSTATNVSGITWPVTVPFVSTGLYRAIVDKAAAIIASEAYTLIVDLTAPGGIDAHWEIAVGGETRTG